MSGFDGMKLFKTLFISKREYLQIKGIEFRFIEVAFIRASLKSIKQHFKVFFHLKFTMKSAQKSQFLANEKKNQLLLIRISYQNNFHLIKAEWLKKRRYESIFQLKVSI